MWSMSYPIVGVSANSFTVSGNLQPCTPVLCVDILDALYTSRLITISGSTGNNGTYTVVSAVFTSPNTIVTVAEPVPDATADGNLTALPVDPYIINRFDGTSLLSITPGTLNTDTDLALPGPGLLNYGESMVENLIHVMEHFANGAAPPNPITGQCWFNSTTEEFNIWNGATWNQTNSTTVGSTYVALAGDTMTGSLTINTASDNLLTLSRIGAGGRNQIKMDRDGHVGWDVGLDNTGNFTVTNNTLSAPSFFVTALTHDTFFKGNVNIDGSSGAPLDALARLSIDTNHPTENAVQIKIPLTGKGTLAFGVGVTPRKGVIQYDSNTDSLKFATGSAQVIQDSLGRVGIQNITPLAPLDIGGYLLLGEGGGNVATAADIRFTSSGVVAADLDMYINVGSTSKLHLGSGGPTSSATRHLTIDAATGNVGVSQQTPTEKLHISDSGNTANIKITTLSNLSGVRLGIGSSGTAEVWQIQNNNMKFATNDTERLQITNSGRVGIGESFSPLSELHIHSLATSSTVRLTNNTTGSGSGVGGILSQTATDLLVQAQSGSVILRSNGAAQLEATPTSVEINPILNMNNNINMNGNQVQSIGNPTTGTDAMSRDYADLRYLALVGGNLTGNLVINSVAEVADSYVRVLTSSGYEAGLEAYGGGQADGFVYVGQSSTFGGGLAYHGDAIDNGANQFNTFNTDNISLYRKDSGVNTPVIWYQYNNDNVSFANDIFTGQSTGNTVSEVYVKRSGVNTKLIAESDTFTGSTGPQMYGAVNGPSSGNFVYPLGEINLQQVISALSTTYTISKFLDQNYPGGIDPFSIAYAAFNAAPLNVIGWKFEATTWTTCSLIPYNIDIKMSRVDPTTGSYNPAAVSPAKYLRPFRPQISLEFNSGTCTGFTASWTIVVSAILDGRPV